ncbi:uncharacterized protein METZ01_LOCUS281491, partial [marine metagenome]
SDPGLHRRNRLLHHSRTSRRQGWSFDWQHGRLSHAEITQLGPGCGHGSDTSRSDPGSLLGLRQNRGNRQHEACL